MDESREGKSAMNHVATTIKGTGANQVFDKALAEKPMHCFSQEAVPITRRISRITIDDINTYPKLNHTLSGRQLGALKSFIARTAN